MSGMKKSLKEKWVKALRSGMYTQCENVLQNAKGHNCCLGVLCRVANIPMSNKKNREFDGLAGTLSLRLLKKFGLTWAQQRKLTRLNDDKHINFNGIANWITQYIKVA